MWLTLAALLILQVGRNDWFPGTSSVTELEVIPTGFRGKWAPDLANCSDQDGVEHMYVFPNGIDFYESGGRLERITQAGQDRSVMMKLAFEGEGGFWERVWRVTLSETGQSLTISLADGTAAETYVRCPQH
ncbi:MAG: hypothetical protein ACT4O2_10615 [Beijerinckiaceae bacterium]